MGGASAPALPRRRPPHTQPTASDRQRCAGGRRSSSKTGTPRRRPLTASMICGMSTTRFTRRRLLHSALAAAPAAALASRMSASRLLAQTAPPVSPVAAPPVSPAVALPPSPPAQKVQIASGPFKPTWDSLVAVTRPRTGSATPSSASGPTGPRSASPSRATGTRARCTSRATRSTTTTSRPTATPPSSASWRSTTCGRRRTGIRKS